MKSIKLLGDQRQALPLVVNSSPIASGVVVCWRMRRKLSLCSGRSGSSRKKRWIRLQLLRQPRRLDRVQALVDIVEQFDLVAAGCLAQMREQPRDGAEVRRRLPGLDSCGTQPRRVGRGALGRRSGRAVRPLEPRAGDRDLARITLKPAPSPAHAFLDLLEVAAAAVGVGERPLARLAAEQRVDRQARALALDVPERQVDPGEAVISTGPPRQ